jgi:ElaB/YqjD/DUF883 family membrane-anchored ribosome-binding protein
MTTAMEMEACVDAVVSKSAVKALKVYVRVNQWQFLGVAAAVRVAGLCQP